MIALGDYREAGARETGNTLIGVGNWCLDNSSEVEFHSHPPTSQTFRRTTATCMIPDTTPFDHNFITFPLWGEILPWREVEEIKFLFSISGK